MYVNCFSFVIMTWTAFAYLWEVFYFKAIYQWILPRGLGEGLRQGCSSEILNKTPKGDQSRHCSSFFDS